MGIVTLAESAAAKVSELLVRDGRQGFALRLAVRTGGCSGLRYQSKFDELAGELDHESHQFGVRVLIDAGSTEHVAGVCIDFTEQKRAGFEIQNLCATRPAGAVRASASRELAPGRSSLNATLSRIQLAAHPSSTRTIEGSG